MRMEKRVKNETLLYTNEKREDGCKELYARQSRYDVISKDELAWHYECTFKLPVKASFERPLTQILDGKFPRTGVDDVQHQLNSEEENLSQLEIPFRTKDTLVNSTVQSQTLLYTNTYERICMNPGLLWVQVWAMDSSTEDREKLKLNLR
ncbi:unnamed protein product [Dovyalis caffra]|uniref:RNA polymerase alpha subunit n=1 Tax=Dovyalis caffra TaxID=77055 RepID=A0AAV1SLX0_9ROSI|nr:unnamed protein product [Dovyalis caffra]